MYLFHLVEVVVSICVLILTACTYYTVLPPPHPKQVLSRQNANGKILKKNNKGDLSLNATSFSISLLLSFLL